MVNIYSITAYMDNEVNGLVEAVFGWCPIKVSSYSCGHTQLDRQLKILGVV
jgi:hypothetical protein